MVVRDGVVPPDLLERATQSLAHRGPDDHGTIILRSSGSSPVEVGLGNQRLAILDLSPLGHQPMQDPTNGHCIVHNGEIYNFPRSPFETPERRAFLHKRVRHRSRPEGLRSLGRAV